MVNKATMVTMVSQRFSSSVMRTDTDGLADTACRIHVLFMDVVQKRIKTYGCRTKHVLALVENPCFTYSDLIERHKETACLLDNYSSCC
jgi:hypothetical protein